MRRFFALDDQGDDRDAGGGRVGERQLAKPTTLADIHSTLHDHRRDPGQAGGVEEGGGGIDHRPLDRRSVSEGFSPKWRR